MSIPSLKAAVTAAGSTPTQHSQAGLLRELVTAIGGTPTQWSVVGLLREAIAASGGTPTKWDKVGLWRELIVANGGTPIGYDLDTLIAQAAVVGFFVPSKLYGGSDRGFAYDFTDSSKLFQNSNGTGAVVNANDPIGYATDLSGKGNHATQATAAARPLWSGKAIFDAVDDQMVTPSVDFSNSNKLTVIAALDANGSANHSVLQTSGYPFIIGSFDMSWASAVAGWTLRAATAGGGGSIVQSSWPDSVKPLRIVTFVFDLSQATIATQAVIRSNGDPQVTVSDQGPGLNVNFANAVHVIGSLFGGDIRRMLVINRKLSAAELLAAEQWAARSTGIPIIAEIPPANVEAGVTSLFVYGQSLSQGGQARPIVSTVPTTDYMWDGSGGVRAYETSTYTAFQAHVEVDNGASGETPLYGCYQMIRQLTGYPQQFLADAPGFGETTLLQFSKGTGYYTRAMYNASKGRPIARAQGKHFKTRAILWMQGESDGGNASYASQLSTLRNDFDDDIRAITLQTQQVYLISYQLDRAQIGLAQLSASDSNSYIRVAMPMYHLTHQVDGVHLTAAASKVAGAYFGLAYKAIILDGNTGWQPLRIQSTSRNGTQVDVVYNPVGDLVFDTTIVAAQTSQGFRLYQSDGTTPITINSVTRVGSNIVRITAASTVTAGAILRYGFSDPADHTAGLAKGNLRDSQGDSIIFDPTGLAYPMHNWAVLEQKTLA